MRKTATDPIKSFTQRALFSFEQFGRHELANHAAAGAYAFLLSAVPALLVVFYLASLAADWFRLDIDSAISFIGPYIEIFGGSEAIKAFVGNPLTGFAGAFGLVNLVWAGRLFVVSMQRGVRVIYSSSGKVDPVRENVLTFAVEIILMLAVVTLIAASQLVRVLLGSVSWAPVRELLGAAVPFIAGLIPLAALWLFVFLTYKNVPPKRPLTRNALLASALCAIAYELFGLAIGFTMNTARYSLLYGILGNLVITLIKVYTFFWMYFLFAELMYTVENFDSLLFARFHRVQSAHGTPNVIERTLFSEPSRLVRKYSRHFPRGETVFRAGDGNKEAFYLYRGSVGVYLEQPRPGGSEPVSLVPEGEFFGEMACVLDEPRTAWAVAETDCTVFKLPPAVFKRYLAEDPEAMTRLLGLLAGRLRANNELIKRGPGR